MLELIPLDPREPLEEAPPLVLRHVADPDEQMLLPVCRERLLEASHARILRERLCCPDQTCERRTVMFPVAAARGSTTTTYVPVCVNSSVNVRPVTPTRVCGT